jgi:hypothetical protein
MPASGRHYRQASSTCQPNRSSAFWNSRSSGADIHAATVRMRKAQALGVQQHAVHALHAEDAVVAAITVAGVADHVVRQVLEVPADLPEAPGLRLAAQQRVARTGELADRHRQLAGGQALEVGDRRLLHRLARPAVQIMVDLPGQLGRPARQTVR